MDKSRRLGYYEGIETELIGIVFRPRAVPIEGKITFLALIVKSAVFFPLTIPCNANYLHYRIFYSIPNTILPV